MRQLLLFPLLLSVLLTYGQHKPLSLDSLYHIAKEYSSIPPEKNPNDWLLSQVDTCAFHYIKGTIALKQKQKNKAIQHFKHCMALARQKGNTILEPTSEVFLDLLTSEPVNFITTDKIVFNLKNLILKRNNSYHFYCSLLIELSFQYRNNGQYNTPIKLIDEIITLLPTEGYNYCLINLYHEKYILLKDQGKYPEAHETITRAIEICKEEGYTSKLIHIYQMVGWVFVRMNDLDIAKQYAKESIRTGVDNNLQNQLAEAYNLLGCIMMRQQNDSALFYFRKSATLNIQNNSTAKLGFNYNNMAGVFSNMQQLDSALFYCNKALLLHREAEMNLAIGNDLALFGNIHMQLNNYNKAEQIYKEALIYAKRSKFTVLKQQLYQSLSYCYEKNNKSNLAIKYLKLYQSEKDSAINQASKTKLLKQELDKQNKAINNLKGVYNSIKNELQVKKTWEKWGILFLMAWLILTLSIIFRAYKRKKHAVTVKTTKPRSIHQSSQTKKQITELAKNFISHIENENRYLDKQITINEVATNLNTNRTYLSQAINQEFNKTFTFVINEMRINEACQILESSKYDHLTIEGIANMVGFQSKTSFINAFKKHKNTTPGAYKKTTRKAAHSV